jgi:hypothetical protein
MESAVLGALSVQSLYYVKDAKLYELDLATLAELPRTLARIEARFSALGVQEPVPVPEPEMHQIARADDDGFASVFGTAFVAEPMVEEDTQPAPGPTFSRPTFTRQTVLG